MKKFLGITRTKYPQYQQKKLTTVKKRNRFKSINKDQDLQQQESPQQNNLIITSATQASHDPDNTKILDMYEQAKENLLEAAEYRRKITEQCKLRITAFKESEARRYDENICGLSGKAVESLLRVEKVLAVIRGLKGSNQSQQKYYRNMQKSLAQQLRQTSKQLRNQQKQHFDRLKSYQKNTANTAIELSQTQKQKMRSDTELFEQQSSIAIVEQMEGGQRNSQITELVKSINALSSIYKELNQLVIEQGSVIDRIDYNIQETFVHVEAGNKHLRGADQKASSPCAEKCIIVMLSIIVIMAIILGFKYSK